MRRVAWLAVAVAVVAGGAAGACKGGASDRSAGETGSDRAPMLPAAEIQRGRDACGAYVAKACACAEKQPAFKTRCDLARAAPEAIQLYVETALGSDIARRDAVAAQAAIRKTVKECIEQTAKLAVDCP